jgi:DNA invertase Pin-like site-specific DNA recombinase
MVKAVLYARVSSKDQEREGYSIPAQLRLLRDYARKNDIDVVREFLESESAGKAGRTAFGQMVDLLKSDQSIRALLVEKTDRLYRNFKDHVQLDDLGIDIHFVKDNRIICENSKPSDKFVHDIETAQARYVLNNLSQEVRKGLDQKARQGEYPGGPIPLGYMRNPLTKAIEIDPRRAPLIRRLFELYATGEQSIDDLHAEAKKIGLTYRKSGRPIVRAELDRIIKRVFYTGRFEWKGQVRTGDHPPIVETRLYDEVQRIRTGRIKGKGSRRRFVFGRLMTCGECDGVVTAEIKKDQYIYYHCTAYKKKHKKVWVPEATLDRQFAQIVKEATLPYDFYDFLRLALEKESKKQGMRMAHEREVLELERDRIEARMKKAYQDKIDGLVSEDFFVSVYEDYQTQLDTVRYRLANLAEVKQANFDVAMKAIELSYNAESLYL